MTAAIVALVLLWLVGWVLGTRIMLARLMAAPTCSSVHPLEFASNCRKYHEPDCLKPVGEVRERDLLDAAAAMGRGLAWPVVLLAWVFTKSVPPTAGEARRANAEMEHRIAEQSAEIDRLHRQIGASVMQREPDEMGWRYPR